MKLLKGFSISIVLTLLLIGCQDIKDCQLKDDTSQVVFALFDRDTTNQTESVQFSSILIENLSLPILNFDTTLSVFGLPVNTTDTVTTFFFESELGFDTLVISYDFQYNVFFEECTPVQSFFDLRVMTHTFDSVSIVNDELNNEIVRNVSVFLD